MCVPIGYQFSLYLDTDYTAFWLCVCLLPPQRQSTLWDTNCRFYFWSQCPPKCTSPVLHFAFCPGGWPGRTTTLGFLALWVLVGLGQWERPQQETGGQGGRSWCLFLASSLKDGFRLAVPLNLTVLFFLLKLSGVKIQLILLPVKCIKLYFKNIIGTDTGKRLQNLDMLFIGSLHSGN